MIVMKFGGTSVGSPERMQGVAHLVTRSGEPVFVVLSAMAGTTNSLVEISNYLYKKNPEGANDVINRLEEKYMQHIDVLYSSEEYKQRTKEFLKTEFSKEEQNAILMSPLGKGKSNNTACAEDKTIDRVFLLSAEVIL